MESHRAASGSVVVGELVSEFLDVRSEGSARVEDPELFDRLVDAVVERVLERLEDRWGA